MSFGKKSTKVQRLLSSFSRFATGIEIHPGADSVLLLFIDAAYMGVVIGETAGNW